MKKKTKKLKRKGFLIVTLPIIAAIAPLIAIRAQASPSAGPDQQVYTCKTTNLNGATSENFNSIFQVPWDFGDNTTAVNDRAAQKTT